VATLPLILAIDAATTTAAALGRPGDIPSFETIKFQGEDHLQVCASALKWIARKLKADKPDLLYIEEPMAIGAAIHGKSNARSIVRLNQIYGIIGGAALLLGVPVIGIGVQKVRQAFLGDGKLERDEAKKRALTMCRLLGWPARNGDEADAGGTWYWGCCCEAPKNSAVVHPGLWSKAAAVTSGERLVASL
jgi:Holliday junction resolvasome RuvABC endonuclease subunit